MGINVGTSLGQFALFVAAVVIGIAAGVVLECVDVVAFGLGTWFRRRR